MVDIGVNWGAGVELKLVGETLSPTGLARIDDRQ